MGASIEDAKTTVREMTVGILITAGLLLGIGTWIASNKITYVLGTLLGAAIAQILLWHMFKSLDEALDLDPETAQKYMRKKSMVRLVMMGLAVGAACVLPDIFNPIGVVFGVLALKLSAYLQPFVHKYIFKKKENE